jgi:O-antigen/teichoic acid export membrane protein
MAGRFAFNSLFGALAGASITLASFLSGVVVARTLGVDGAGAVAYAVSLALIIAPLLDLGASPAVGRYVPEMRARSEDILAERLAGHLARVLAVSVLIATALVMMLIVLLHLPSHYLPLFIVDLLRTDETAVRTDYTDAYWSLVGLYVATQVFSTYVYCYLRGRQCFGNVFRLAGLSLVVQIAGVAAGGFIWGVSGAIAGYVAGQILPAVGAFRLMARTGPLEDALLSRVRHYARYAWAANIASVFVWSRVEIFFLQRYAGSHDVGIFAAALALSNLATQGPVLLTTGVLPLLAEQRGRGDHQAMQAANETGTRLLAALVFPACFGTAAIMPVLVPLIYGSSFMGTIVAATILVSAAAFSAITAVGSNLVYAMERSDFVFVCSTIGAVLAILSGFVLVPQFGLMGAVVSRIVIQTLMVAIGTWFVITRLKYSMPIASLCRLLCAAVISAGIARFMIAWFTHPLILMVAIPTAAAAYVVALRGLGGLSASDLVLLGHLSDALPAPAARVINGLLNFVAGPVMLRPAGQRTSMRNNTLCRWSHKEKSK